MIGNGLPPYADALGIDIDHDEDGNPVLFFDYSERVAGRPGFLHGGAMSGLNISAGSDRDTIPLVRVPPDYPARAVNRGIEGWVLVEFTITGTGSVKDAKVVDAKPATIFNDAALKAISRWRYNPKVENGQPVERRGVRTIIRFDLEN